MTWYNCQLEHFSHFAKSCFNFESLLYLAVSVPTSFFNVDDCWLLSLEIGPPKTHCTMKALIHWNTHLAVPRDDGCPRHILTARFWLSGSEMLSPTLMPLQDVICYHWWRFPKLTLQWPSPDLLLLLAKQNPQVHSKQFFFYYFWLILDSEFLFCVSF